MATTMACPTLLLDDHRRTLIAKPRSRCGSCNSTLADRASFCGMCGKRIGPPRFSLTGRTIDALYHVEEAIARGGFATVYRAVYLPTRLEVALKVLHPELARDPLIVQRFRREAKALTRLRSPHTVAILDHGETADGALYIAMELLRGESLHDRIHATGPLPWRMVLSIMHGVAASLAEAHAHGLVHRDLKPANIHLGPGDFVKVLDFGLAKCGHIDGDDTDLTRAGHTVGTTPYMPPEQLGGNVCDGRSDLYALGVVGYEMLTGRRPFHEARTGTALMAAVLAGAPDPASSLRTRREVPDDVDKLLARCLARVPDERYAGMRELAAEIERILAIPVGTPRRRQAPHTPAFESEPPRIVVEHTPTPAFVDSIRGSALALADDTPALPEPSWIARACYLLAFVAGGVGIGSAIAKVI